MLELYKNIKKLRTEKGLSQSELAALTGYTDRSSIAKIEKGEVDLTESKINAFANALGVRPIELMGWDNSNLPPYPNIHPLSTRSFPVLGAVACGEPILMSEEIELYVDSTVEIKADYVLIAKGDSMINARINDGDIVFVRKQDTVENGEIAVVSIDDEATLKRFYYDDASRTVTLVAENPSYAPMVFGDDYEDRIHIMGKAVAFQSDVK